MCINYVHSDRFLIIWETFFVQCSYAVLVLLRSGSSHNQPRQIASSPTASVVVEAVRDKNAFLTPVPAGREIELLKTLRPAAGKKPACA
jgi:hypothetical protein